MARALLAAAGSGRRVPCGASSIIARGRAAQVGDAAADEQVEGVGGGVGDLVGRGEQRRSRAGEQSLTHREVLQRRTKRSGASTCGQWPKPSSST